MRGRRWCVGLICIVVGDNEHMRVSLIAAHTHASRDGKLSDLGVKVGAFLQEGVFRGLCVVRAVGTNVG